MDNTQEPRTLLNCYDMERVSITPDNKHIFILHKVQDHRPFALTQIDMDEVEGHSELESIAKTRNYKEIWITGSDFAILKEPRQPSLLFLVKPERTTSLLKLPVKL